MLGLTILRGEQILSTVVEDKPLLSKKERLVRDKKEKKQAQKQTKLRKEKEKKPGKIAKPNTANAKHTSSNLGRLPNHRRADTMVATIISAQIGRGLIMKRPLKQGSFSPTRF